MIISVKVNASSKVTSVKKLSETDYDVRFKANREHGEANTRLIALLAEFLGVAKSRVRIVRGQTGTRKVVEITD